MYDMNSIIHNKIEELTYTNSSLYTNKTLTVEQKQHFFIYLHNQSTINDLLNILELKNKKQKDGKK